jgi:hypothetical protein
MQTGIKAGAHTMQTGIKAGAQSMQTGVKSGLPQKYLIKNMKYVLSAFL